MNRIVCIGNRYVQEDAAGYEVYLRLKSMDRPSNVEIIDGGLGGLDLLRFVEGCNQVVFVDTIRGFDTTDNIAVLSADEVADMADNTFQHAAGLPYLLRMLPQVCEGPMPGVRLVGIENPTTKKLLDAAANKALELAAE